MKDTERLAVQSLKWVGWTLELFIGQCGRRNQLQPQMQSLQGRPWAFQPCRQWKGGSKEQDSSEGLSWRLGWDQQTGFGHTYHLHTALPALRLQS